MAPPHLLIVSHDVVGELMAGPGIRYWELGRALAAHLSITLVAPRPIDLAPPPGVRLGSYTPGDAASLAGWLANADMALVNGHLFEAHPELATTPTPLIVDLYDPTLLENLELFRARPPAERAARSRRDAALLAAQLAAGDCFLCATERQRDLYIGALMLAGRVTPAVTDDDAQLRRLIDVVPFGLPDAPPARQASGLRGVIPAIGADDHVLLWSGGLWDWMDPQSLVQAMPAVVERFPQARAVFLAGAHPGAATAMRAGAATRAAAEATGLLDRAIFFHESWVPYARRADMLLDADVLVSLHRNHLETRYAALRSRVLDHFWAGRPSLLSDGDEAAALVRARGAGEVVPPQDAEAVAAALVRLLGDGPRRAEQAARALALAEELRWPRLIGPILRFAQAPARRRLAPAARAQLAAPEGAGAALAERRNAAARAVEERWAAINTPASGRDTQAGLRGRLARLLARPLLPLLAAQIQAAYASAELSDHLARTSSAQTVAFAEQLRGLEDAVRRLEALQRGEEPAPPREH